MSRHARAVIELEQLLPPAGQKAVEGAVAEVVVEVEVVYK